MPPLSLPFHDVDAFTTDVMIVARHRTAIADAYAIDVTTVAIIYFDYHWLL